MTHKIGIIVGSLRKLSFNRKIAEMLVSLAPASLKMEFISIADLPLYNQDYEDENKPCPEAWTEFRKQVKACDGILFCTPEYNRSMPGVLKNAIDVGSRPYGQSVWNKKPTAVISAAMGAAGGFGANHHLRQTFVFLNMPCMQQPEAYLGQANNLFNEKGKITNEGTLKFLQDFIHAYAEWVETAIK